MLIYIIILICIVSVLFVSTKIGNFCINEETINLIKIRPFLGFSILMFVMFVITYFLIIIGQSSITVFNIIIIIIILLLIESNKIKIRKFKNKDIIFVALFVLVLTFLSLRYTLGEQMGDSTYVFIQIIKNINTELMNNFDYNNGLSFNKVYINPTKSFISFYHLFSLINFYITKLITLLKLNYIPAYVVSMWISNILFYIFSAQILLSIKKIFKIESKMLFGIIFVFLGLYIGSYYYNVTLPHIGLTFLNLSLSVTILVLFEYFRTFSRKTLVLVFILIYSMNAYATTGALYIMVFSFGIVSISIFKRNRDAFLQIPLFLIPIFHYTLIIWASDFTWKILLYIYIIVLIISLLIFFIEKIRNFIFSNFRYILLSIWIMLFLYSNIKIEGYWLKVLGFFVPQSAFDRVQDYFSFLTISNIFLNIFQYLLIICIIIYKKTRDIGKMLILILIFFINPFMRPIVAENIAIYEIYSRIFFTVFNTGTLGMGLVALYELLKESKLRNSTDYIIGILTVLLLIPTYQQVTTYFYPTYIPRETDYNPLYKMSNNQIEILEKMRQIVVIEEMENPLIISQIFGTAMYAPEFVVLGYNVNQQRYGPVYIGQELYEIFYTPAIPADDGPRLNAPVRKTCELLINQQIDFVLYDKSMSIYDKEIGDYMPIYWYIRDCGTFVHENDRYILYRFFWD